MFCPYKLQPAGLGEVHSVGFEGIRLPQTSAMFLFHYLRVLHRQFQEKTMAFVQLSMDDKGRAAIHFPDVCM